MFFATFSFLSPVVEARSAEPAVQLAQTSAQVRQIIVAGVQRIEPGTVRTYLLIQEVDDFHPQRIDRSLKSLFATGLFADVSLRRRGDSLIVFVVENPVINRIAFEGNNTIENEILESEVWLRPRVIYTRTKVQNDVKRILSLYRNSGRFAAVIEPKVIQLPQNRVDLVFEIGEGEPTEIRSIRFVGNREFSDRKLRGVVRTTESAWYKFLSSDDAYDPDRLTLDRELLRQHYLSDGFADFRVISSVAELTPDRRDFFITFSVKEGNRYQFGTIDIEVSLQSLEKKDLEDIVEFKSGDWYDVKAIDKAIQALTNRAGELGVAFIDVRPRINRNRETQIIDITFEINEGPRVFVERIDIVGNVRTLDKVIRREFRLVEGDAFNAAKLRRSRERIQKLDFFQTIEIEQQPGSATDKTIVQVGVTEKSTGSVSLGAGFSTTAGFIGETSLRERNFLGQGQDLSLKLTLASTKSQLDLSFTEPYFMNREIRAGFDIYRVSQDLQDFSSIDTERTGLALRAGYPISERLSQSWRYELKKDEIKDVASNASTLIQAQRGSKYLSEISHTIALDTTDSRLTPTKGYFANLLTSVAGLGGSVRHFRNLVRAGIVTQITDQWILTTSGKVGYIIGLGEDVEFLQRFFIGGDDLRGFATSGVGPRDKLTGDSLGGEWKYTGRVQLTFPMAFLPEGAGLSGRFFSDVGSAGKLEPSNTNVGDTASPRISVGTGLTWMSPFGPMGVDLAFPLVKEDFDEEETFRINFGTQF